MLSDVIGRISTGVSVNAEDRKKLDGEIAVLKVSCVLTGRFDPEEHKVVLPSEIGRAKQYVKAGSVIVSRANTPDLVGASAYVSQTFKELYLPDKLWQLTAKPTADGRWMAALISAEQFRASVRGKATGSSGSMKNISQEAFLSTPVLIPPLSEQRHIADILATWDRAIDALGQQINLKERVITYLRVGLTSGARRFGGREQVWPLVRLRDVSRQLTLRNGTRYGRERVMGVTKIEGLVPMKEHVIAEDIGRYLVLPPQAFAYNPMRINIGSIVMSEADDDVIVSPDYVVFSCLSDRCHPRFLNHLRRTRAWQNFMTIAGNGSVRVRIYYSDLANFEFHLPPLDEQISIISILDDADRELAALRAERHAREAQRDALASELLTGRLRVREPEPLSAAAAG